MNEGILNIDFNLKIKLLFRNANLVVIVIMVEIKLKRIFKVYTYTLKYSVNLS